MGGVVEAVVLSCLLLRPEARVFATPPVVGDRGRLVCRMTNEADRGRRVRVEALDAFGVAAFDSGAFTLAAGGTYLSGGGFGARQCRFTVRDDLRGVRAHGLLISPHVAPVSLPPEPIR